MNLPLFIALRMSRSSSGNKPGVMERVAVISVALSLTVMILALAVMLGFKREVSQKVAGFSAHVVLCGVRGLESPDVDVVQRTPHLDSLILTLADEVALAPYAAKGGIVRTADAVEGVLLKGVGSEYDWSLFRDWLIEGDLPRVGDSVRTKDILISRNLSKRNGCRWAIKSRCSLLGGTNVRVVTGSRCRESMPREWMKWTTRLP